MSNINLNDAAHILSRSPKTLAKWAKAGQLEATKVNGQWMTTREACIDLIDNGTARTWHEQQRMMVKVLLS